MGRNIDLDAARRARLEVAEGEDRPTFTFERETFELPLELPYEVLDPIGALAANERDLGALHGVIEAMIGEDQHRRFRELRPSLDDVNELVGHLFEQYGLGGKPEEALNGDGPGKGSPH